MERRFDMTNIENEAAPLREEKRKRNNDTIAQAFAWACILLMALCEVTGIVFIILKVAKAVTWTWPVTLIPIWILLAMTVTAGTLFTFAEKFKKNL